MAVLNPPPDGTVRRAAIRIAPADHGVLVLAFLVRRFTYHAESEWTGLLARGRLLVNGVPVLAADHALQAGDRLEYLPEDHAEPPVDNGWRILLDESGFLAIDKPGNLPCHPGGRYFRHTLWHQLRERLGAAHLSLVNRLDRETSGLVLAALNPETASKLQCQFARRTVRKSYLAVVEGVFPATLPDARGWMLADAACEVRKKRRFQPAEPGGAPPAPDAEWAETGFRSVRTAAGLSLIEATPHTGRLHQIRATLQALGFPVVGDKLYGLDPLLFLRFRDGMLSDADRQRLRLPRQALHAWKLSLRHPATGLPLELEAPPPPDLLALVP